MNDWCSSPLCSVSPELHLRQPGCPGAGLVIVVCHHCDWRSDPVPPDRVEVGPGGITVQAAGTPMQHALSRHVIDQHRPIERAWVEGRDWEVVPA